MMLTGGKWGEAQCLNCGASLGALITCHHCGYINSHVDSVYTSPEHVEKTAKSIHDKSTNLCQNSTGLVETDKSKMRHRYAGSFGG